ncbi:MAG: cytochrome P460 family protein [Anaerolineae bacterium]|nr:cytochrome P460 family protein [Anaerolineae bacterium]
MSTSKRFSLILAFAGLVCVVFGLSFLHSGTVRAYHEGGPDLPADYRYWYHVGSKSITPEGATAIGLPAEIFGNSFDAVFANTVALNDLRSNTRPFRDGAVFVAPFFKLENPVAGLDAPGTLLFTAVMEKDSEHFAETNGWGFEAFAPDGTRLTDLRQACVDCHNSQEANDFVFSSLSERNVSAVPASDNGVFLPTDYRELYWRGSKVIRPDAATAIGLPAEIFGNTFDSVYMNSEGLTALRSEVRPFPVGSLFVAEFHAAAYPVEGLAAQGDLAFTAVMLKGAPGTGDDASTGDWKFEAFGPDGTPLKDLRPACISCHAGQSGNDFVFSGG